MRCSGQPSICLALSSTHSQISSSSIHLLQRRALAIPWSPGLGCKPLHRGHPCLMTKPTLLGTSANAHLVPPHLSLSPCLLTNPDHIVSIGPRLAECLSDWPVPSAFLLDTGPCEQATPHTCSRTIPLMCPIHIKASKHWLREYLLKAGSLDLDFIQGLVWA